jgi:hypothetical protein
MASSVVVPSIVLLRTILSFLLSHAVMAVPFLSAALHQGTYWFYLLSSFFLFSFIHFSSPCLFLVLVVYVSPL